MNQTPTPRLTAPTTLISNRRQPRMNFADQADSLQAQTENPASLPASVNPRDSWPAWTDQRWGLGPIVPCLADLPPSRRDSGGFTRRGFLGSLAAAVALPWLASRPALASPVVGPGPIRRAYDRYQSLRPAINRIADMADDPAVDEDWQEQALADAMKREDGAETEVARRIAVATGFDVGAFCASIADPYRIDHNSPLAVVREGATLFMLFATEAGGYFGTGSYALSKSLDELFTVRVVTVDLKEIAQ